MENSMQATVLHVEGRNLKLDNTALQWLGNNKELLAVIEGDSMIIKKRHSLLDFAQGPDEDYMTPEQVNEEIHNARRSK
jgi:hypothetical protein